MDDLRDLREQLNRDYFTHYGYAVNPQTGEVSEERTVSEGMHYYKFRKDDGVWRIAKFEVYVHRREEAGTQK